MENLADRKSQNMDETFICDDCDKNNRWCLYKIQIQK